MKCPFELPLKKMSPYLADKNNLVLFEVFSIEHIDYIFTACNCHEDLVGACEMGLVLAQMLNHPDEFYINAALAKAKVKE